MLRSGSVPVSTFALAAAMLILSGQAFAQRIMKPAESLGFAKAEITLSGTFSDQSLDDRLNLTGRLAVGLPNRLDVFVEGVLMEDPLVGGGFSYQWLDSLVQGAIFGRVLFPMEDREGSPEKIYSAAALIGRGLASVDAWAGVEHTRSAGEGVTNFLAGVRVGVLFLPFALVAETGLGQDTRVSAGLSMRF